MKKTYLQPLTEWHTLSLSAELLTASGDTLPRNLYDDETADGDESLSRRRRSVWDDEEDIEDSE